jgi:energy-coupling factor transporter ATP-binding protein EcfA2
LGKEISKELIVKQFGQIEEANLDLGDLTLFIGPQASGKSIILQLFKLINDHAEISRILKMQGFDWKKDLRKLLELYFGENMGSLWSNKSSVSWQGQSVVMESLVKNNRSTEKEKVFYIPAQRVITLDNGWPRSFNSFRIGDPFVVKNFSEHLRLLMEAGLGGKGGSIFPQDGRMKQILRSHLDQAIFHGASVMLDSSQLQRRLVLKAGEQYLPYMTWSAGQREFMPLLLGLYWLMPPSAAPKKAEIEWVVIEEPEMGLHPQAILSLVLIAMELIWRGYRVIISSHSPILPQALWAIRSLQQLGGKPEHLCSLFQVEKSRQMARVFEDVLSKTFKTFFFKFDDNRVRVEDISALDPWDENDDESDWGGLTRFSSRVSDLVSSLAGESV